MLLDKLDMRIAQVTKSISDICFLRSAAILELISLVVRHLNERTRTVKSMPLMRGLLDIIDEVSVLENWINHVEISLLNSFQPVAHFLYKQFGLFKGGEMTSMIEVIPILNVGISFFCPRARCSYDFLWKTADSRWELDGCVSIV